MSVTELAVKKPLAIIMFVIFAMGLGIFGYSKLGADLFPSVDTPFISIVTTYPGAGAEQIEKDVVKPIEDAVSGVSGIDTIKSGAAEGYGYTMLKFTMSTNLNTAFMDVQQALGDISNKLPKDARKPVLKKYDKNAQPIMMLTISGSVPYEELYSEADDVSQKLERLEGVGGVTLQGGYKKELSIKLDKTTAEFYGVTVNTVTNLIQARNMNIPAGEITQETKNQTLKIIGEFGSVEDIKNMKIPLAEGGFIPLSQIAEVSLQYPEATNVMRYNQGTAIGVFIQKQSDANIVKTADTLKKEIEKINKGLPKNVKITIAADSSTFINSTLKEVNRNLVEGIITTSIIMFLFLKQIRPSLIVLVSIPTSLVATFFMMYVFHFTLNILSLLALSLSIGILVDDSIVVLENIQRHLKQGKGLIAAAVDGRKEIGMAAIAITLCDIVVFGPVAFMSGMIGKFFREFGLTVIFATSFSLIVSFTLTPMLASRMLKKEDDEGNGHKKQGKLSGILEKTMDLYRGFLIWALDNKWKIVSIIVTLLIVSASLIPFKIIGTEFLPNSDQSQFTIDMNLNPDAKIAQTDTKVKQVEKYLKTLPEVKDFLSSVGSSEKQSTASITVNLVDKKARRKTQGQMADEVRKFGKTLTGVEFTVTESSVVGKTSDSNKPIAINLTGTNNQVLKDISKQIEDIVKSVPGITDVDNSMSASQGEISVKLDPLYSSEFGINPVDVMNALKAASHEGVDAGVFRKDGDEYDIVVKFKDKQVTTPSDIGTIKLTSSLGQQVELNQFAAVYMSDTPQQTLRMDKREMVSISANIQGDTLGNVSKKIQEELKKIPLPAGYEIKYGGDQQNMSESFSSLIGALVISIVLVYMILVILYESFLTPFLRMLSLPCGAIGALAALAITGKTLSIVSMIGLIMLDGLASKNGTLLIDYTNTLMKRGLGLREALLEAGVTRLKPILMTSVTMIVGMLPSAIALGDGSEIKSSMSIVLVGGLITSTMLSPILIPVAYTILDDLKTKLSKRKANFTNSVEVH